MSLRAKKGPVICDVRRTKMEIAALNLTEPEGVERFMQLLDAYCHTPGGGGASLSDEVRNKLFNAMPQYGNMIAFLSRHHDKPTGVVLGFYNLFVFSAQPYANVQFIFVLPEFQRQGIAKKLMLAFEAKAHELGCCKVTLEVRESNERAKALYSVLGYRQGTFGPCNDALEFWERRLY